MTNLKKELLSEKEVSAILTVSNDKYLKEIDNYNLHSTENSHKFNNIIKDLNTKLYDSKQKLIDSKDAYESLTNKVNL